MLLEDTPVLFLLLDGDARAVAARAAGLGERGVRREQVIACNDPRDALRALRDNRSARFVAFVAWPLEDVDARSVVRVLGARGAYVIALLPPDQWDHAVGAHVDGVDDVLLTPCPPEAFAVRAMLAADVVRRARPSPWFRPRAVLREALAHANGGEVVIRGGSGTARVLVSEGRIAWVHDDSERGSLAERLRAVGVQVTADELSRAVAECRRTGEHFADVLARWGIADREAVKDAARAILDARLRTALAAEDGAAIFAPSRWRDGAQLGFTSDELGVARASVPPRDLHERPHTPTPSFDGERLARIETIARDVSALEGCVAAAVLHYGAAVVVSAAGESEGLAMAWTLGTVLHELGDPNGDALACSTSRCHVARRIPADDDCFAYATFDLTATSVALARRSLALALERIAPRSRS